MKWKGERPAIAASRSTVSGDAKFRSMCARIALRCSCRREFDDCDVTLRVCPISPDPYSFGRRTVQLVSRFHVERVVEGIDVADRAVGPELCGSVRARHQ